MAVQQASADEIIPGFWLGNRAAALDPQFLKDRRIHAVFNFSKDIPFVESVPKKYRTPVDDNLHPEEIRNLELWAPNFVESMMKEWGKGPILVHCHAGMQRSAAATAMFLIRWLGTDADSAMSYVNYKRPITFQPAANFRTAILGYERSLQGEAYRELITQD